VRKTLLLILMLSMCVCGCVQMPREHISRAIEQQELSDHVHFLAQPALKGRKPKTFESWQVRKYLKSRFQAYGLVSWCNRAGYEQPFGFGTNMIGVLPGSDPNLADEIILISAHYDHVGKTKKGILLGACDNASGIAVLLEVAEQLSMSNPRPKRPICFAAFDCEENNLFGAFAFTCQQDFDESEIAAVINVDLLGRDFLEVVGDSLFVTGTGRYPKLREEILEVGQENSVKVLSIGSEMAGPRGDHAAFETLEVPVIFFTCGVYKDYHKPTDTPDRLSYAKMTNSVQVISRAVDVLANWETIEKPVVLKGGDKDELSTLAYILAKVNDNHEQLRLDTEQGKKLHELAQETQHLLNDEKYSLKKRKCFARKAIEALSPAVAWCDSSYENSERSLLMYDIYAAHSKLLTQWYRDMVGQLLEDKPGIFDKVNFEYQSYALADDELSFVENENGQYELDIILAQVHFNYEKKALFKPGGFNIGANHDTESFLGTKEQVTDYCLLRWRENLTNESYGQAWRKVLETVTEQKQGMKYADWFAWWSQTQGWDSEKQWLENLAQSDTPEFIVKATKAIGIYDLCMIIKDPNVPALVRISAIYSLGKETGKEGLLALVDVLDDETELPTGEGRSRIMDDSYPFADHRHVKFLREAIQKSQVKKITPGTIGGSAKFWLVALTQQEDFGTNKKLWREWIEDNVQ